MMSSTTESRCASPDHAEPAENIDKLRAYKSRWFVLFVVSFINFTGGLVWISLAHVDREAKAYYAITDADVDLFSFFFLITTVVLGPLAMWLLDHKGLTFGLKTGAILLLIGTLVRAIATSMVTHIGHRVAVILSLVGQFVAGCGQPFVQFTPSKVADNWFGDGQRLMATTAISMSTPVGLAIGSIVPPFIVEQSSSRIELLTWLLCVPCIASSVLSLLCRNSRPPTPPNISAMVTAKRPFATEVKHLLKQKPFNILLILVGSVLGFFLSLVALIEDMFDAINPAMSGNACGYYTGLLIFGGVVGAFGASYVAKNKIGRSRIMKASVVATALFAITLFTVVQLDAPSAVAIVVPFLCVLLGFFGFIIYPLGLALCAECAFPDASSATCSGLVIISGYLQAAVYMILTVTLSSDAGVSQTPYVSSMVAMLSLLTTCSLVFITTFDTEYKRMREDVRLTFDKAINRRISQRTRVIDHPPCIAET